MPLTDTISVLNGLLATLSRSFPQYLRYARPYVPPGHERMVETLAEITEGQDELIERISQEVANLGGSPDRGEFPMLFTDTHDLGIDFLVQEATRLGKHDVAILSELARTLNLLQAAKALAEETLGMTKAHVQSLEELIAVTRR